MTTPADDEPAFSEEVDYFYEFTEPPGGCPLDQPTAPAVVTAVADSPAVPTPSPDRD